MRLVRSPNIVAAWRGGRFEIEEFRARRRARVSPLAVLLLDRFGRPARADDVARDFPPYAPASVAREIRALARLDFLVPAERAPKDTAEAWKGILSAAYYHWSSIDSRYIEGSAGQAAFFRKRLREEAQPPFFKSYRGRPLRRLDPKDLSDGGVSLLAALDARETVRRFSGKPVPFAAFSATLQGTFGQTRWLEAGMFGRLPARRSPSGGGRHPIECYVLAWSVEGLPEGAYHYDVRRNALARLRRGGVRRRIGRLLSGQSYFAGAGYLCVMAAVVARTLWKYPVPAAYRTICLDAGHLAQSFVLLAAARGLGPFQTAAIQHAAIADFLGLDPAAEPPLYACGAGMRGRVNVPRSVPV